MQIGRAIKIASPIGGTSLIPALPIGASAAEMGGAILCSWEPVEFDNSTDFDGSWYNDYGSWNGSTDGSYGDYGNWTDDWNGDGGSWNGSSVPWWGMSSTTTSPFDRKRRQVNLNLLMIKYS